MSNVSNYELELSILEKGAKLTYISPEYFVPDQYNVLSISPGTWLEDPITGENIPIQFWFKATEPVHCPTCQSEIFDPLFIRTKKHLVIYCSICDKYTFLTVKRHIKF